MVSVAGSDQILRMVRAQLERMAKKPAADAPAATARRSAAAGREADHAPLEALRSLRDLDQRQFNRMAVKSMLALEFGSAVADSPAFGPIADRVREAIEGDPELARQFAELRREMAG